MSKVIWGMLVCLCASAQSIKYDAGRHVWLLTTQASSYAMGVSAEGELQHLYWGGPLWRVEDVPAAARKKDISSFDPREMLENEEFPGWGGPRYYEPALKITRADGDRDLVLHYVSHQVKGNELTITLKDIHDDIEVALDYGVHAGTISRKATIHNRSKQAITLESAQSAAWYLPAGAATGSPI